MDNRSAIWRQVAIHRDRLIALSDRVWATPEVCSTEERSCTAHMDELTHHGFEVTRNIAGTPAALIGEAGESGSVIGFLGEFDALPGLSQEAGPVS